MGRINNTYLTRFLLIPFFLMICNSIIAQDLNNINKKSDFFNHVKFGGALGLGISNNYTDILLAPSAIYQFSPTFALGLGIQGSYIQRKDFYKSWMYGPTFVALVNPIPEIQLSMELEQLRVNNTYTYVVPNYNDDFWNTALFLGAGYRSNNATIGVKYNVLYKKKDHVYNTGFMPFVRIYF
ncbi:hypothetical protein [Flavobacterium sp. JP2137]|uniref:hypothetical protein n=1 Tax=Flavobacterium sp. JP2137 TaxID=3414510 RepID=UPI003D2FA658